MSVFADYPAPPGNKRVVVAEILGPSSYTVISAAAPPTGGVSVTANELGLKEIEYAWVTADNTGTYGARVIFSSAYAGRAAPSITLQVFTLATGAEVSAATDLDAVKFRLFAVGM